MQFQYLNNNFINLIYLNYILKIHNEKVTSALMGVDKANQWAISYISAFGINTFLIEIIQGYLKVFALKLEL